MKNFVILSGGSGSRLWPKSREKMPKQLLDLTNEYTMLQNTILRVNKYTDDDIRIYIICNKDHTFIIEKQVLDLNINHKITIINEPIGRDSGPAICISALLGHLDDTTIIVPCDHVFDDNEFINCCKESDKYIGESIITFGIKPTHVETGYGYIQMGLKNETQQFIEKPNYELAKTYFESGNYYWNGGIFLFQNKNMITCFQKYAPDILETCMETIKNTSFDLSESNIVYLAPDIFKTCRAISVDYCIMELLCKDTDSEICGITIPYHSYWNDIGSYSALYNQLDKDENKNVIKTDFIGIDTKNCYIQSNNPNYLITTIGIDNVVIVSTDDALLVCNKDKTQDVKKIVDSLKKEDRIERLYHTTVFRPWGWYKNIEGNDNSGFKVKRIAVYSGKRLSLQSHNHRSEHWVIVKGSGKVQVENDFYILKANDHIFIPQKALHRIENIGDELLEFTETQIGAYLGEDDIIRYEDDFGRV